MRPLIALMVLAFVSSAVHAAPPAGADRGAGLEEAETRKGFVTATGEVVGSTLVRLASGEEHQMVKLRGDDGKRLVVDLGIPGAYPAQAIRQGERIVVSGKAGRIDGRPVVFARYVGQLREINSTPQGASGSTGDASAADRADAGASVAAGVEATVPPPTRTDWSQMRASAMLGTRVATPGGKPLGWIAGLLFDTRPYGTHYALLSVREEDGEEKRFAFRVDAFWRGGGQLLLDASPRNLAIAPGYEGRAWPAPGQRSGDRYVRARDVIGHPIADELGGHVGTMEDVVLSLETGRTAYVMVEFEDGAVLPVPDHAVRFSSRGAPAVLQPDSHRRG